MMKFLALFTFISVVFGSIFLTVAAAEVPPFEFHAYGRSNFQIARGLAQGADDLNTGWGAHNRLQEGQYFELTFDAKPLEHTFFVATLSSGTTSYPYDNSIGGLGPIGGSWLNVRNLYLLYDQVGGDGTLWFGARMFRGDAIYIFDTWPLDDHDLIGGGYIAKIGSSHLEFAIGTNKDSGYGVPGNSVIAGTPTFSANTQRYLLIGKSDTPIGEGRLFKTNLEFQYLPDGIGTDVVSGSPNNGTTFALPSDYGVQAGVQFNPWREVTAVLNYGYGNVVGNWGSASLNIVGQAVTGITSPGGTPITDIRAVSAKGAQAITAALYGQNEFASSGLLYGVVPKFAKTADGHTGSVVTAGVRPMYYLTEHLHLGGEVDLVVFPKKFGIDNSEISYVEVTPLVEYALTKSAFGAPKFFVAAANAFYTDPVTKNGQLSTYATNWTIGMEVWF